MFVFVILHYLSEEMTVECVDKLTEKFGNKNIHIVIVDNASSNASGERIQAKYGGRADCTVLLNQENLGFARGNNVGYCYARQNLNPDHIIVMNNDVLIEDEMFLDKVDKIYRETDFHVLGPDIIACKTGIHQNPMRLSGYSRSEVEKIISDRKRWLSNYRLHYCIEYTKAASKRAVKKLLGIKPKAPETINQYASEKQIVGPVLHGACYIFSKKFIDNEESAFDPNTFLYFEEDILHYKSMAKGYKMVYDSSICVHHMEDVSTDLQFRSQYAKKKMKYQNLINSATVLLNLMNEETV